MWTEKRRHAFLLQHFSVTQQHETDKTINEVRKVRIEERE